MTPLTSSSDSKHQCLICKKQSFDRKGLASHTGAKQQSLTIPHKCPLCEQRFGSEEAVRKHQNEPSHDAMFKCDKCDKCDKRFESVQALASHRKGVGHLVMRSPMVFVPAGWSGHRSFSRTEHLVNTQLDGEDGRFCDQDGGWCGQCTETSVYGF